MELHVDFRERPKFEALLPEDARYVNLPAGDFAFVRRGDGSTAMVLERKTVADLCASMADGRYAEQKGRCIAAVLGEQRRVGYIIEGCLASAPPQVRTAAFSMQHRDRVMVFVTSGQGETAALVLHLLGVAPRYDDAAPASAYIETIKVAKAANCTGRTLMLMQLSNIPRVSATVAEAIAAATGADNMGALIDALRMEGAAKLIAELRGAGGKRLGPALANGVIERMLGPRKAAPERTTDQP